MSILRRISSTLTLLVLLLGLATPARPVSAQTFQKNTTISNTLTDVQFSSVEWGDYDNDGDLDILLTGLNSSFASVSEVYTNDGQGGFTKNTTISGLLTDVGSSSVEWGDYDNDGDLDILLTGCCDGGGGFVSEVYDNDGQGGFAKNTTISGLLTDVYVSSVEWGDYDNDGDLDILLTGNSSTGPVSEVYDNDGQGGFAKNDAISNTLTGVSNSSVEWGDYDNDGDLDILLTGDDSIFAAVSEVYDNDGQGGFTKNTTISGLLTSVRSGSVAWGDYDNDGDLDILLTGFANSGFVSEVYDNDGQGGFTKNTTISLTGVTDGSVAWGDYDNDGDLDILLTGANSSFAPVSEVYDNDGQGGFTKNTAISNTLTDVYKSSVEWGDYDNDGDLDILLTGSSSTSSGTPVSEVYENTGGFTPNAPPAAPTSLTASAVTATSATLTWSAPTDDTTPTTGLSYGLRIGTTAGGQDILAPMSLLGGNNPGRRTIVARAPVQPGTGGAAPSWTLEGLAPGTTYYWSVQALDQGFAGSAFSAEGSFTTPSIFTKNTTISGLLTGVLSGSVAWGDYDNDGDLDILLTGGHVSEVYDNDGQGGFTKNDAISNTLTGVRWSSVEWGDYDNDGDLDILLTGRASNGIRVSEIYDNDGPGGFTKNTAISNTLTDVWTSSVEWGDYDNDGDLDILLTGRNSSGGPVSEVYDNDGQGGFTKNTAISNTLTDVWNSSVEWGDYDNDGDLDILLTGSSSSGVVSEVYENDGPGGFTKNTTISNTLTDVRFGSVAWGDYDNDGDLDILLTGDTRSGFVSEVYTNDGQGGFTKNTTISGLLTGVSESSVEWGDYDNDGDLDILLTGRNSSSSRVSEVYDNDGQGGFTKNDAISNTLTGVAESSVEWGDYDNDGDLDILLTGNSSSGFVSEVYENTGGFTPNASPAAPTSLTASVTTATSARLAWSASTDDTTPTNGLSYGLRLGTTAGGQDILAPMSLLGGNNPGRRTIVARAPVQPGAGSAAPSWTVEGLAPGTTYYWSVQALDQGFAGSVFSAEGSFTTPPIFTKNTTISGLLTDVQHSSVAFGDYDNDGDLDILLTGGSPGSTRVSEVYDNDGQGGFTKNTAVSNTLTDAYRGAVEWGDYDNDGDLDILLTGENSSFARASEVWDNDGAAQNFSFTKNTAVSNTLLGVRNSSVAWGDYDNDGDLDILLTGNSSTGPVSEVYDNDGQGGFTKNEAISLTAVDDGSVAWGDYDNDGDLDILLTGCTQAGFGCITRVSEVWDNDGQGGFTQNSSVLTGVDDGSVAWGDYDNDGDLDILLTGSSSSGYVSEVYTNDGQGGFTKNDAISNTLLGVRNSSVAWGDYDNDGDLDILLTGQNSSFASVSEVYDNDGQGGFTKNTAISLTGVRSGSVAWGDYDNDGDLDILLTGANSSFASVSEVWENTGGFTPNAPPAAPTSLTASAVTDTSATLAWSAPTDDTTPADGLSYNLRLGTTAGGQDILAPMSLLGGNNPGRRTIVARAPVQPGAGSAAPSWTVEGLAPGTTYYWSVQAIDQGFAGSAFAAEGNFTTPTPMVDLAVSVTESVDPVVAGSGAGNLIYTVTVTNAGPSEATGVALSNVLTLPSGVTLVSVTPSVGTFADPTWTLGTLASGASDALTVVLTVDASTVAGTDVIADTAAVTAVDQTDTDNTNDTADEATSVTPSGLTTRYVATTGSDTANTCLVQASPCATLTYAVAQANAGDTIFLDPGSYAENGLMINKAVMIKGPGALVH